MNHPAEKYNVSENPVSKWKRRDELYDRGSGPHKIYCSLADIEQEDIKTVRRSMRLPPDEIEEMARQPNPSASRSAVYRPLLSAGLNKVPEKEREKAKKFKEYEPRYLHVDVTYRPKIDGVKQYLFVAVDRATRTLFYQRYDAKTAENAENFMNRCEEFFPFKITHILTDNGLEFTNAFLVLKKGRCCENPLK